MTKAKQPAVGDRVHYAGKVWKLVAIEPDPNNVGSFVDLERTDEEGKYDARIHTAQMAPDTTGGQTFLEERPMAGNRHAGDPRYPLTPEHTDRHQRFAHLVDLAAEAIFKHSRWKSKDSWTTLDEARKDKLRRLVRAEWTGLGVAPRSPPGVTRSVIKRHAAAPEDLQDWLKNLAPK